MKKITPLPQTQATLKLISEMASQNHADNNDLMFIATILFVSVWMFVAYLFFNPVYVPLNWL